MTVRGRETPITVGEPAPWIIGSTVTYSRYRLEAAAGRWLLLAFFHTTRSPAWAAVKRTLADYRSLFNDTDLAFFGVTEDPEDAAFHRVSDSFPGIRFFLDVTGEMTLAFGFSEGGDASGRDGVWCLLSPSMRVVAIHQILTDCGAPDPAITDLITNLQPKELQSGIPADPPVLVLDKVFPDDLCERLRTVYREGTPEASGFMREVNGQTVLVSDPAHKRRRDVEVRDPTLIAEATERVKRCLRPMIKRAFQFDVTRMERHIVACYSAADVGHFRAHRDNTTPGTAHRRFAVSIFLSDDYAGGELRFPEFGRRGFKPHAGSAVVFSCSLMHQVDPVTEGERFVYLPFLYDEAAAEKRISWTGVKAGGQRGEPAQE